MLLVICMAGIRCASPTVPTVPEKNYKDYEYRYIAYVTYTRPPADANNWGGVYDSVYLEQWLYDPERIAGVAYAWFQMDKTGPNAFKSLISTVYIQKPGEQKHALYVHDHGSKSLGSAENLSVEGAYDLEVKGNCLLFRMAKD
jgi:hypothetical protein